MPARLPVLLALLSLLTLLALPPAPSIAASPLQRLSAGVAGSSVLHLAVSPDGRYAVFIADHHTEPGLYELFSAPTSGGEPVRLNAPLPAGERVIAAQISGGAAPRVAYLTAAASGNVGTAIFSVPIAGGESTLLAEGDALRILQITPDDTVLFNRDGAFWRAPLDGATPPVQRFDRPAQQLRLVDDALFFLVAQPGLFSSALYRLPLDGSAPARRIDRADLGGVVITDYGETGYTLTDDATYAVYTTAQVGAGARLYSVLVAGPASAAVALSDPAIHGSVQRVVVAGDRALFVAGDSEESSDLYSVPVTGGAPVLLSPNLREQGGFVADVAPTPDARRVIFKAVHTLYHAPITGPTPADPIRLIGDAGGGRGRLWFFSSPDSLRAHYVSAVEQVHTAWLNGSREAEVHYTPIPESYGVLEFQPTPDRDGMLFIAETDTQRNRALYYASGSGQAQPLSDLTHPWMPLAVAAPGVAVYAAATSLDGAVDVYAVALPRVVDPALLTEKVYLPLLR